MKKNLYADQLGKPSADTTKVVKQSTAFYDWMLCLHNAMLFLDSSGAHIKLRNQCLHRNSMQY